MEKENIEKISWCNDGINNDVTSVRFLSLMAETLLEIKELLEDAKN